MTVTVTVRTLVDKQGSLETSYTSQPTTTTKQPLESTGNSTIDEPTTQDTTSTMIQLSRAIRTATFFLLVFWVVLEEVSSLSSAQYDVSNFAMDPHSEVADQILLERLNLSLDQQEQLATLSELSFEWNQKVNLMSRRQTDSTNVIFGRHVLPSLAPLALLRPTGAEDGDEKSEPVLSLLPGQRVCDVGTGGGFPGLPLAVARPDLEFVLIDSVGKKINAVQDMADRLGLTNVQTFHGRAEEYAMRLSSPSQKFDWVVGRSVAAIPTYCYWIQDLLKDDTGNLVYLIGGDIDDEIMSESICDEPIEDLLGCPNSSDKQVICFPYKSVRRLAAASGERPRVNVKTRASSRSSSSSSNDHNGSGGGRQQRKRRRNAKGEWRKRDTSAPKKRGYESFQRFDSLDQ